MANARHKNTIYVDSTGSITVDAVKPILYGMIISPNADSAIIKIRETNSSGVVKVFLQLFNTESRFLNLARAYDAGGIELTSTFYIDTLTNIANIILIGSWYASDGGARG
jgi:hypothetical protein